MSYQMQFRVTCNKAVIHDHDQQEEVLTLLPCLFQRRPIHKRFLQQKYTIWQFCLYQTFPKAKKSVFYRKGSTALAVIIKKARGGRYKLTLKLSLRALKNRLADLFIRKLPHGELALQQLPVPGLVPGYSLLHQAPYLQTWRCFSFSHLIFRHVVFSCPLIVWSAVLLATGNTSCNPAGSSCQSGCNGLCRTR